MIYRKGERQKSMAGKEKNVLIHICSFFHFSQRKNLVVFGSNH